jgi:hypothetical protein
LRVDVGSSPNADLRIGVPRFRYEFTVDLGSGTARRFEHTGQLRLASGGNANREPAWVVTLKAKMSCSDSGCSDHQESVGVFFTSNRN